MRKRGLDRATTREKPAQSSALMVKTGQTARAGTQSGTPPTPQCSATASPPPGAHHTHLGTLRMSMPINIRSHDTKGALAGNQFVPARFAVPMRIADPPERVSARGELVRAQRNEAALSWIEEITAAISLLGGAAATAHTSGDAHRRPRPCRTAVPRCLRTALGVVGMTPTRGQPDAWRRS